MLFGIVRLVCLCGLSVRFRLVVCIIDLFGLIGIVHVIGVWVSVCLFYAWFMMGGSVTTCFKLLPK